MVKKALTAIGLIAGVIAAGTAQADVNVTGELGTTGAGFHVGAPVHPNVQARFGTGYLIYSYSSSTANLDYDLKLKSNTYDALLDWYPIGNSGFRLTGGVAYNGNRIDASAKPNAAGVYTLQGTAYNAATAGRVDGKIDFRKTAPYLGIGWGKTLKKDKGWGFSADAGVLLQGAPRTSLVSNGCTAPAAVCAQLAADLATEHTALANKVGRYKTYPVLRIGVSYKF